MKNNNTAIAGQGLRNWRVALVSLLVMALPAVAQTTSGNAMTGQSLFTSKGCAVCHTASGATKANAINAGGHIAHANTQFMGGQADADGTQFNHIAAYFATLFTDLGTQNASFGASSQFFIPNLVLNTALGDYVGLRTVANPSRGSVSFSGITATYTPFAGQCGADSFTYEAYRTINAGTSNLRTLNLIIGNPPVPDISGSAGSISGTQGSLISTFFPLSSGGPPSSYALTGALPAGLTFNSADGSISGTPAASGSFNVTLSARNCFNGVANAQSASKLIAITIAASGLSQATLTATATPNPVGSLQTAVLSTTGGSGNGAVTYSSGSGSCTISGATLTAQAASGSCLVTATKAGDGTYQSASGNVTVNLLPSQSILFSPLAARTVTDPPFTVTASGGASGNPVTFIASGSCSAGGTNGATITISGTGTCTITASQAGNASYAAAPSVSQSFMVIGAVDEVFPANCQLPAGWSVPVAADTGWIVAFDRKVEGACSLKTNPLPNSGFPKRAEIAFTGDFLAGNITFRYETSFENGKGCLTMLIDDVVQTALGSCVSGLKFFSSSVATVPITAGTHTVVWRYEKTASCCAAGFADAAWIDDVRMPLPLPPAITGPSVYYSQYDDYLAYPLSTLYGPATITIVSGEPFGTYIGGGYLQGSLLAAGTYTTVLRATNSYGTTDKTITFNIGKRSQDIVFGPPNNRLPTAPPFTVSAYPQSYRSPGGYYYANSGPVTFTTSGVCNASGAFGETITLSGATGLCSITANQPGNANFLPANPVTWDVQISAAAGELFPPACAMPAGWTVPAGADAGWSVSVNEASSEGACSLKSNPVPDSGGSAIIEYTGTFQAGFVMLTRRISSEPFDCLYFMIDGNIKGLDGSCSGYGIGPISGEWPFNGYVPIPITAGTHTLRFEYRKDTFNNYSSGQDAAWIDELTLPLATLTVSKSGAGTGRVVSTPAGIDCGSTCSKSLSGKIMLTAVPSAGSAFTGWSGGGCSGTGTCTITLTANVSIAAAFALVSAPSAPQAVTATPGALLASLSFSPPASNGGGTITQYTASCSSAGQVTRTASGATSPISVNGLAGGVTYACTITATNTGGTGPASAPVNVTPITLSLTAAASVLVHATVGEAALPIDPLIPVTGAISVDPRPAAGSRVLRFQFDAPVSSVSGASAVNAANAPIGMIRTAVAGNDIVVTMDDIPDATRVKITLPVINGANLNTVASVGFLVGDVSASGVVSAADIAAIKARINAPVTAQNGNARFDLNGDGLITSADVSIARARAARRLP